MTPGRALVVEGAGLEASVQDADETVAQMGEIADDFRARQAADAPDGLTP